MRRAAVMAHYDPTGGIGPHVRRQLEGLAEACEAVVVVSTARLTEESRAWFAERATLVERANYGYDFLSYRTGLETLADRPDLAGTSGLGDYDEVVVCNDTYVPVVAHRELFDAMAPRPVDFWGLTTSRRYGLHVQSFFVAFRGWVVRSEAFGTFWSTMTPLSDRTQVIARYEVGLSRTLREAGFRAAAYFVPTADERRLAGRRWAWFSAHRDHDLAVPHALRRALRTPDSEQWNPSAALADRFVDGRLPFVKIDTLRYDPYGLGAARLLGRGEETMPAEFAGVRDFLAASDPYYPPRPGERLRPTPLAMRPLRRSVEYFRG